MQRSSVLDGVAYLHSAISDDLDFVSMLTASGRSSRFVRNLAALVITVSSAW